MNTLIPEYGECTSIISFVYRENGRGNQYQATAWRKSQQQQQHNNGKDNNCKLSQINDVRKTPSRTDDKSKDRRTDGRKCIHLEVGHEGEERHQQGRDHDHQPDRQVHRPVRGPDDAVPRPVNRLVHVAPPDHPRRQAGLHHQEVQQEPDGTWWQEDNDQLLVETSDFRFSFFHDFFFRFSIFI